MASKKTKGVAFEPSPKIEVTCISCGNVYKLGDNTNCPKCGNEVVGVK
jgi:rRNA maturation endonuclease Nob1